MNIEFEDGKNIQIDVKKNNKGVYEYHNHGVLIGVYNPEVMGENKFLEIDLEKNNTLENELSAESKDEINQIIKEVKENIEQMSREQIEDEAKVNETLEGYLKEIGVERENVKVIDFKRNKKEYNKANLKPKKNVKQQEETVTKKDVNIKQEVDLNERADDIQDLKKWLGGKIPNNFYKLAVVPTDDMTKFKDENGKSMNKETSRYSLVLIGKDGKVEPLKKYIPQLEQNHSVGTNPRKEEYQINSDGKIEKDAIASEYRIGNKIIQIDDDFMDNKEINIAKLGPFTNEKVTRELRDRNAINKPNREILEASMKHYGGIHKTEESYNEAMQHEEVGEKPEEMGIEEVDGDKNTGHQHFTREIFDECIDNIMDNEEISDTFSRKEVEQRLMKNIIGENKELENLSEEEIAKIQVEAVEDIRNNTEKELEEDAVHLKSHK